MKDGSLLVLALAVIFAFMCAKQINADHTNYVPIPANVAGIRPIPINIFTPEMHLPSQTFLNAPTMKEISFAINSVGISSIDGVNVWAGPFKIGMVKASSILYPRFSSSGDFFAFIDVCNSGPFHTNFAMDVVAVGGKKVFHVLPPEGRSGAYIDLVSWNGPYSLDVFIRPLGYPAVQEEIWSYDVPTATYSFKEKLKK
jgi:hypothetical protein